MQEYRKARSEYPDFGQIFGMPKKPLCKLSQKLCCKVLYYAPEYAHIVGAHIAGGGWALSIFDGFCLLCNFAGHQTFCHKPRNEAHLF